MVSRAPCSNTNAPRRTRWTRAAARPTPSLRLGRSSKKDLQSELVAQLAATPAAAALTSVPGILLLPGAVLIKSGDEVIGSIGVGGAPSGFGDGGGGNAGGGEGCF